MRDDWRLVHGLCVGVYAMTPGDRVTLPDGRTGIIWRMSGQHLWISLDKYQFNVERWNAVDVVVERQPPIDPPGQLRLPLEGL